MSYDEESNKASISFATGKNAEILTLNDVPIQILSNGIRSCNINEGDRVYVQFNNGSVYQPKIIGIADEKYYSNTRQKQRHSRKGEYIDVLQEKTGDVKPSSSTWITENKIHYKYSAYKIVNPILEAQDLISSKGYFKKNDVALYNPSSTSIVKIKDNGDIDVFVSTNIGFRVSASKKEIEFFGDISSESNKWSISSNIINLKCEEIKLDTKKIIVNGENIIE